MLTVEQYKLKFPNESSVQSYTNTGFYPGLRFITEGLLQFNSKTACWWGGPFAGGYAHFVIRDYTNAIYAGGQHKNENILEIWSREDKMYREKLERNFLQKDQRQQLTLRSERPSSEFPISTWMFGNDDTSYSKFYRTEKDAMDEINLFSENEPLDFYEIVDGFNFVFTN